MQILWIFELKVATRFDYVLTIEWIDTLNNNFQDRVNLQSCRDISEYG